MAISRTGRAKRESLRAKRERTAEITARLHRSDPTPRIALDFRNGFELLIATVLAAQCTDERVNAVTPELFRRFPTPRDLAGATQEELEELVHATGFFRNKARAIKAIAQALAVDHGGEVPPRMDDLRQLPGVGRKTANAVLGNAFGLNEGIMMDTHVLRVSGRLGLTAETDPEKMERDLMALVPRETWTLFSLLLTDHGRKVCKARKPECAVCEVADLCPSAEV
jgi:endonuclease-3